MYVNLSLVIRFCENMMLQYVQKNQKLSSIASVRVPILSFRALEFLPPGILPVGPRQLNLHLGLQQLLSRSRETGKAVSTRQTVRSRELGNRDGTEQLFLPTDRRSLSPSLFRSRRTPMYCGIQSSR